LSVIGIFEHVKEVDCYSNVNVSIVYQILFIVSVMTVPPAEKSLLKLNY
jgi:hypothetical protein